MIRGFETAFILISILFSFINTSAQTSPAESNLNSFISAQAIFQNEIKADSHLYTGKKFIPYSFNIKDHPFFETDQMQSGDIFYDGTLYKNILFLYDLVAQTLVINRFNSDERIQLLNEKIKYFTFDGHRFENIFSTGERDESITNTFYDVMFTGKASVLIKRIKHIKSGLKVEDPTAFLEEDELYVRKGKNLYAIDSRNSVEEAFNDKKALIKTFIRKHKFRFKKHIEKELLTTAEYYSKLN